MLMESCFSAGKIRYSHFHFRGGPVEVAQLCFGTRNVLKLSFDKCTGCAMLVNSCFSAGKIRESHCHLHEGCTAIFDNLYSCANWALGHFRY